MNKFQERYDELSDSLNASNERLRELKGILMSKEEELIEFENYIFNKQVDMKNEKEIRDDMIDSKTKKLDKWTFNITIFSLYLIVMGLYYYLLKPYVFNGFLHKINITNELLGGLALVGTAIASLISLAVLFIVSFGISVSIKEVIKKKMVSKIKKSKDYVKTDEKVSVLEQELKEARQNKTCVKIQCDDLSCLIKDEENVCEGIKKQIENLKNEIVGTVIVNKNNSNTKHKNKAKVRSKKEENI